MKIIRIVVFLLTLTFFISHCKNEKTPAEPKILTGWLTTDYLFEEIPEYQLELKSYQPDSNIVSQLKDLNAKFDVLILLGTYCPDCKREVPRFVKIINQLGNDNFQYKIFGLDRAAVDTSGMRQKYEIEYIPTFIVYFDEEEIGRIVETPMVSIENDLLEICTSF